MIDGDGCIYNYPNGRIGLVLVGSRELCEQFLAFAGRTVPFIVSEVRPGNGIYRVAFTGSKAKALLDVLYSDCNVALDRKFLLARKAG